MSNVTKLVERIPKIGEFYITLNESIYLCLGFTSYKNMVGLKVGGTTVLTSETKDGRAVLNFDTLYPHLCNNIKWFLENTENFSKGNLNKHQALSIKTLKKIGVTGRVLEAEGVIDGFSIDADALTVDLLTLKMLGLNLENLQPHEYFQDIERAKQDKAKSLKKQLKSDNKLVKPEDLVVGKVYECLDEKPYKYAIYLGCVNGWHMIAGHRTQVWQTDQLIERLYESETDFENRKQKSRYFYDTRGVYSEYAKIRCYKNLPNMYKESPLKGDDLVDIWWEEKDRNSSVTKISVFDWAYDRFKDGDNMKAVLNRTVYIKLREGKVDE